MDFVIGGLNHCAATVDP